MLNWVIFIPTSLSFSFLLSLNTSLVSSPSPDPTCVVSSAVLLCLPLHSLSSSSSFLLDSPLVHFWCPRDVALMMRCLGQCAHNMTMCNVCIYIESYYCLLYITAVRQRTTVFQRLWLLNIPVLSLIFFSLSLFLFFLAHRRTFTAIIFTAISVGRASSFTSDANRAQSSAARIFHLFKRRPAIDSTSSDGLNPVSIA